MPDGGRLVVCATPIGNLGDVTLRVLEALKSADVVAAEDTRVTRKLFARHGISTPLERCDEHTIGRQAPLLVERMLAGDVVALVSDAGTPGISDPGARLISAALDRGAPIEALPGPSALLAALVVSGLPMNRFYFGGFLPRKAGERGRELDALARLDATLVFFESPRRAAGTLEALARAFPEREAALARELTKIHEEVIRGSTAEVARRSADREFKGEVVLVVGPPAPGLAKSSSQLTPEEREDVILRAETLIAEGMTPTAAAKQIAKESGIARGAVYDLVNRR